MRWPSNENQTLDIRAINNANFFFKIQNCYLFIQSFKLKMPSLKVHCQLIKQKRLGALKIFV